MKLSEPEIVQIDRASSAAGARWKDALQDEFRRVMLARAQAYLAQGHGGTDPYHDGGRLVSLGDEFARLASGVELERRTAPRCSTTCSGILRIATTRWSRSSTGRKKAWAVAPSP